MQYAVRISRKKPFKPTKYILCIFFNLKMTFSCVSFFFILFRGLFLLIKQVLKNAYKNT